MDWKNLTNGQRIETYTDNVESLDLELLYHIVFYRKDVKLEFTSYFENEYDDNKETYKQLVNVMPAVCSTLVQQYIPVTIRAELNHRDGVFVDIHITIKNHTYSFVINDGDDKNRSCSLYLSRNDNHDYISISNYESCLHLIIRNIIRNVPYISNCKEWYVSLNKFLTSYKRTRVFVHNPHTFLQIMTVLIIMLQKICEMRYICNQMNIYPKVLTNVRERKCLIM